MDKEEYAPGFAAAGQISSDLPVKSDAENAQTEATVLHRLIAELTPLSREAQKRMIDTVCIFFGIPVASAVAARVPASSIGEVIKSEPKFSFSETEPPSPKRFMLDKAPTTDIERIACLAYYLTHYRSMPHFKTKDLSDLNTEAAQRRFSNATFAVVNATNAGFLVPSVKGCKQLSAAGEQFVQALPDRDAARETLERINWRRGGKRSRKAAKSDA